MMFFSRFAPFLISAAFFIAALLVIQNAHMLAWAPAIFCVFLFALAQLTAREDIRRGSFWFLLLAPFLFSASGFAFLVILSQDIWKWGVSIFIAIMLLWFFQNVFQFAYQHDRYQPHAIENISTYMNIIAVFFLISAIASLRLYVHIDQFLLLAIGVFGFFFFVVQLLWVNKLQLKKHRSYLVVLPLLFGQILWSALWLPIDFFVVSMIVTLGYYAITNLARQHLLERLEKVAIRRYAVITALGIILILSTASWT